MGELSPDLEYPASQQRIKFDKNYYIPGLEVRTRTWIYETHFEIPLSNLSHPEIINDEGNLRSERTLSSKQSELHIPRTYNLVVEGIKMGAAIYVNGFNIGNVTDQFLRYIFPISTHVLNKGKTQSLSVIFDPSIDTHGRFMACSGGWDWAPYSLAGEMSLHSRRVFSFGINKPIYIAEVYNVSILHVVPKVYYLGSYSKSSIPDEDFELKVDIFLQVQNYNRSEIRNNMSLNFGEIIIISDIFGEERISMRDHTSEKGNMLVVTFKKRVPRKLIELWWPNGSGTAQLYTLSIRYHNSVLGTKTDWIKKRIGKSLLLF